MFCSIKNRKRIQWVTLIPFVMLLFVFYSCKKEANKGQNVLFYDAIKAYLDNYSESIISNGTIRLDSTHLKPGLSEINVYLSQVENVHGSDCKSFVLDATVARMYNTTFLPDDYKVIDYKGKEIKVFYSLLDTVEQRDFIIEYTEGYDYYFGLNDHPIEWALVQCDNYNKERLFKNSTIYWKEGVQRIKEIDNYLTSKR